jgi:hypothetical protein
MRTSTFYLGHIDALVDACAHVPDFGRVLLDSLVHVDTADSVVASIDAKARVKVKERDSPSTS